MKTEIEDILNNARPKQRLAPSRPGLATPCVEFA
jgi:hypothetical protein